MSRINYGEIDDLASMLSAGRWEGRVKSALNGRPAQKTFRELEAALLALPEKRLISSFLCDADGCVCALGALAAHKGIDKDELKKLFYVQDSWGHLEMPEADDVADWAERNLNMTFTLAWLIQEANDETYEDATPEQRWEKMLAWTRSKIK